MTLGCSGCASWGCLPHFTKSAGRAAKSKKNLQDGFAWEAYAAAGCAREGHVRRHLQPRRSGAKELLQGLQRAERPGTAIPCRIQLLHSLTQNLVFFSLSSLFERLSVAVLTSPEHGMHAKSISACSQGGQALTLACDASVCCEQDEGSLSLDTSQGNCPAFQPVQALLFMQPSRSVHLLQQTMHLKLTDQNCCASFSFLSAEPLPPLPLSSTGFTSQKALLELA